MSLNQRIKRILLTGLAIAFLFIVALFVISSLFSDKIGEKAIQSLQKQVITHVSAGKANVSMFPYFPKAAIKINNLYIQDTEGDTLALIDEVAFRVSIFSLISGKIELHTARLKGGIIKVKKLKDHTWNYNIFHKDTLATANSELTFSISKAVIEHCEIQYRDIPGDILTQLFILSTNVDFQYVDEGFVIETAGKSILDEINIDQKEIAKDKAIKYHLRLAGDAAGNRLEFKESMLEVAGNPISISGKILTMDKGQQYDLIFACEQTGLGAFLQLLPKEQMDLYGQLSPKGNVHIQGSYKGLSSPKSTPVIQLDAIIDQASLSSRRYETQLDKFSASLSFTSDQKKTVVKFENDQGILQSKPVRVKGEMNLNQWDGSKMEINAHVPLALIFSFAGIEGLDKGKGNIHFDEVIINGHNKYTINSSGQIKGTKIKGSLQNQSFEIPEVHIILNNDQLSIESFEMNGWKSDIQLNGQINGGYKWLTGKTHPEISLDIKSKKLDINKLLEAFGDDEEETEDNTFASLEKSTLSLKLNLDKVYWRQMDLSRLNGQIELQSGSIQANVQSNVFDGYISTHIKGTIDNGMKLHASVHGQHVDLRKLMIQCEEFNQDFITSANLKGTVESRLIMDMAWNQQGEFIEDQLIVKAAIQIDKGELIRMSMMDDFAKYVKIEDLRHIKFTSLHNLLEIKNKKLYIPAMFIQSNALNLTLSGQHTFENQMDYAIQVNAGQVAVNRFKKHNPELVPVPARERGFFNIYYRISGFPDNLQYTSDRKLVGNMFKESDIRRDQMRKTLIDYYGPLPILFDSSMEKMDYFSDWEADAEEPATYIDF
jgi:hypothetical protein